VDFLGLKIKINQALKLLTIVNECDIIKKDLYILENLFSVTLGLVNVYLRGRSNEKN